MLILLRNAMKSRLNKWGRCIPPGVTRVTIFTPAKNQSTWGGTFSSPQNPIPPGKINESRVPGRKMGVGEGTLPRGRDTPMITVFHVHEPCRQFRYLEKRGGET